MNSVELIGRLTRDPEVKYTSGSQMAMVTFNIAIDRPQKNKNGEKQTDFPRVIVFGSQAESCEKYLKKGRQAAIQGRLQTSSYQNKHGETVYTTEVMANRVEFLDYADNGKQTQQEQSKSQPQQKQEIIPGFAAIDEDVPF